MLCFCYVEWEFSGLGVVAKIGEVCFGELGTFDAFPFLSQCTCDKMNRSTRPSFVVHIPTAARAASAASEPMLRYAVNL